MAAIGICWADGAWIDGSWIDGAWTQTAPVPPLSEFLQDVGDLSPFFDLGSLEADDLTLWWDAEMGFAETITHSGGSFSGIFDDQATDGGDEAGPLVRLQTDDEISLSIAKGDTLTIRGRTFTVNALPRNGVGQTTAILTEFVA